MARQLVSAELWNAIEPLLPSKSEHPKGGRPWVDDWVALAGILFVLINGIPWEMLPQEMGCCGMTCWRRLRDWYEAGVWEKLHNVLLNQLQLLDKIDWSRASVDASTVPAPAGGENTGPNPTDRRKSGTKRHLVVDKGGIPLGMGLSGANVNETTQLSKTVDKIPPVKGRRGRPRRRPRKVQSE